MFTDDNLNHVQPKKRSFSSSCKLLVENQQLVNYLTHVRCTELVLWTDRAANYIVREADVFRTTSIGAAAYVSILWISPGIT